MAGPQVLGPLSAVYQDVQLPQAASAARELGRELVWPCVGQVHPLRQDTHPCPLSQPWVHCCHKVTCRWHWAGVSGWGALGLDWATALLLPFLLTTATKHFFILTTPSPLYWASLTCPCLCHIWVPQGNPTLVCFARCSHLWVTEATPAVHAVLAFPADLECKSAVSNGAKLTCVKWYFLYF